MLRFILLLSYIIYWGCEATAQNLVLNGSYEISTACPTYIAQAYLLPDWNNTDPSSDSCSTPDLYAACAPISSNANSPSATIGFQNSRTGSQHAGLLLGDGGFGCTLPTVGYREYLQGTLITPLVAGELYCVKFYVSLADNVSFATNAFSICFTNTPIARNSCPTGQPIIGFTPQLNFAGSAITNTTGWTELQWTYVAAGGEKYFTIGNFKDDANTTYIPVNCAASFPLCYYYIDDVTIIPGNCCADSVQVLSTPASCNQANGTASINAMSGSSTYSYTWSNGGSTSTISGLLSGNYTVTVTSNTGCTFTKSISVLSDSSAVGALFDVALPSCGLKNGSITSIAIKGGKEPYTITWMLNGQTISTSASISNLEGGDYKCIVTDSIGCSYDTTINVVSSSIPLNLISGVVPVESYISPGDSVSYLVTSSISQAQILWTPSDFLSCTTCSNPVATPNQNITYTITVIAQDNGKECLQDTTVFIQLQNGKVFMPNAFTPNGDGNNDLLKLLYYGNVELISYRIFNRWGELVFETNDIATGWDGSYKGVQQPSGVFIYYVLYQFKGRSLRDARGLKGSLTLIR